MIDGSLGCHWARFTRHLRWLIHVAMRLRVGQRAHSVVSSWERGKCISSSYIFLVHRRTGRAELLLRSIQGHSCEIQIPLGNVFIIDLGTSRNIMNRRL